MTDTPETIWMADNINDAIADLQSLGSMAEMSARPCIDIADRYNQYRLADLPATDAQALANTKVQALVDASSSLIADVRRRYPNEELRCTYMIAMDAALAK